MANTKKFNIRIFQKESEWITEITRRVSSKKIIVSKTQGGFNTELEASEWGKKALATFLENHNEKNKRHTLAKRKDSEKVKPTLDIGNLHE